MNLCYLNLLNYPILPIKKNTTPILYFKRFKKLKNIDESLSVRNSSFIFFQQNLQSLSPKNKHLNCTNSSNSYEKIYYYVSPSRFIFWFRYDLSFEENLSLKFAMSLPISPIFIYCFNSQEKINLGYKRRLFIKKTLDKLRKTLLSNNIEILISNRNANELIPILVKKYKSTNMIYSLNTFVPLNYKKEKVFFKKLNKIGVKPIVFLFNPLTMNMTYPFLKNNFKNLFSFFSRKYSLKEVHSKKSNLINFKINGKFTNKNPFSVGKTVGTCTSKENKFTGDMAVTETKKIFCDEISKESTLNCFRLKKIFSEFSLGFRVCFTIIIKKKINYLRRLIENVLLSALLKYLFSIKKIKKKDLSIF